MSHFTGTFWDSCEVHHTSDLLFHCLVVKIRLYEFASNRCTHAMADHRSLKRIWVTVVD